MTGEVTYLEAVREGLAGALRDGTPLETTFVARRRDGSTFHAEIRLTPARDPHGELLEWIAIVDDVSDRVEALERLASTREVAGLAERVHDAVRDRPHRLLFQFTRPRGTGGRTVRV